MGKAKRRESRAAARALPAEGAPRPTASPAPAWGPESAAAAAIVLTLANVLVYARIAGHTFTDFDDNDYVSQNEMVTAGLSARGAAWAFTTFHFANWHPLTWLSHMLDCTLFGVSPGRHLLVNLALHAANTVLLLCVLRGMTGQLLPAALVAGLHALHPLHVESVAWIAERKDVLSTLFWILAMGAYGRYARRPSAGRYAAVAALMALGLMAKPMVVTLPAVFLLMDLWPLGRLPWPAGQDHGRAMRTASRLVLEKVPLFALSAASSALTFLAQRESGAVQSLTRYPLSVRAGNAALAYAGYLGKTFWPSGLACYYPYRPVLFLPAVLGAVALLGAITAGVLFAGPRRPHLAVGWLWFLGTLVPVIGLVQVGGQAMADRYTYVPLIGIFIMVSWEISSLADARPGLRGGLAAGALATLLALGIAAHAQAGTWRDRHTLFAHAVAVTRGNSLALGNLADALRNMGRIDEALVRYAEALAIDPASYEAHINMGIALSRARRPEEALAHYREAARIRPAAAMPHYNMAPTLIEAGRFDEAVQACERAVVLDGNAWEAHYNMGLALARLGRHDQAVAELVASLEIRPGHVDGLLALGITLSMQGQLDAATQRLDEALRAAPGRADIQYAAGNLLLQRGRHAEALPRLNEALRLDPSHADAWNNLGMALLGLGRGAEALAAFDRLAELRPGSPEAARGLALARQQAAAGTAPAGR